MLALISPTLQALYLKEAGPASFNLEDYDSLSVAGTLVMPVLEHYEMLSCPFYLHANSLMHLYKLSLPNVRTIIWESQWTKDLNKYTDGHKRKAMIPPYEYRARVTRLVGWAAREKCYALQGETLYFDPTEMTSSPLEMWVRLLPNLVMLAVPGYVKWDRMDDALIRTTTLVHLHVGHPSDDFIALVCILEKPSRFLPHLETLTVYYRRSLNDCLQQVNESFILTGLEPLSEPLINNSMTRTREYLQATYTLCFDAGTADGFFLNEPWSIPIAQ
ncbi:hypothetical protein GALMADRAFT_217318 [Galerina marginata CBS 339.88]|uniref:Uncharacterized protein n=1 Tax=Galerina marginata (strain CBS 339.88) TaxID=685588 RepID=A0A067SGU4_GALM3|nr:hypothetical protein GALMADRAFT_217318 [Galerina marginata CBS 339.88]